MTDEDLTLVDRWEQLGAEHVLKVETLHDSWPRVTCWTTYVPTCSCGYVYPRHAKTQNERRPDIQVLIELNHLRHLVTQLLDEDWVPESKYIDWIPQEQA